MRFLTISLLLTALMAARPSAAQNLSSLQGSFVNIGFGARPVGMGFAFTGLSDDANAVYWNPAGLAGSQGAQATAMHTRQFNLVDYQYLAISTPMTSSNHALGLAVISSGDDALREISVHAAYAFKWKWLRAGMAGKFRNATFGKNSLSAGDYDVFEPDEIDQGLQDQVDGFANGWGLDAGLMIQLAEGLQVGTVVRDVMAPVSWRSSSENTVRQPRGEYSEALPFEWVSGVSYKPSEAFLAVADFKPALNNETDPRVRMGVETTLLGLISLRGGTDQVLNTYKDETYTAGAGLRLQTGKALKLAFDYAYVIAPLANSHRFSVAFRF